MGKRPVCWGHSKAMKEKIHECLSRVNAVDLMNKRVGTLSGGELQRVLLALALEPYWLIFLLGIPGQLAIILWSRLFRTPKEEKNG